MLTPTVFSIISYSPYIQLAVNTIIIKSLPKEKRLRNSSRHIQNTTSDCVVWSIQFVPIHLEDQRMKYLIS